MSCHDRRATTTAERQPRITQPAHDRTTSELGFWRKYVFSTDHKTIGIQYAVTALSSCSSASA